MCSRFPKPYTLPFMYTRVSVIPVAAFRLGEFQGNGVCHLMMVTVGTDLGKGTHKEDEKQGNSYTRVLSTICLLRWLLSPKVILIRHMSFDVGYYS